MCHAVQVPSSHIIGTTFHVNGERPSERGSCDRFMQCQIIEFARFRVDLEQLANPEDSCNLERDVAVRAAR